MLEAAHGCSGCTGVFSIGDTSQGKGSSAILFDPGLKRGTAFSKPLVQGLGDKSSEAECRKDPASILRNCAL